MYDSQSVKIAGLVGAGIHLYSQAINSNHFEGIYEDFANGEYVKGTLKAGVPLLLPYAASYYSRREAQKEVKGKISALENRIKELEEN